MSHPYRDLPPRAFWRTAVTDADCAAFPEIYLPTVQITTETRVATAGSCFAQHIGRYLRMAGCKVIDAERPLKAMTPEIARRFGYGVFSGRYGNIYTARQMCELLEDVESGHTDPVHVWQSGNAFVDAFRPTIEPDGLDSVAEVLLHRQHHLARLADMLVRTDVFVFTLGLTEAWGHKATGRVYPVCPGVAGGSFDPDNYVFHNFTYPDVLADLHRLQSLLRGFNPDMKLVLTVSPVPLTATATGAHVLNATTQSKATLRAAAGDFVAQTEDTDYVPSYEIITATASGGPWFDDNMRTVSTAGVEKVMRIFLTAQGLMDPAPTSDVPPSTEDQDDDDLICEDILLQTFAK